MWWRTIIAHSMTALMLMTTGVMVLDETIEEGYTIPIIADAYWDFEEQFIDEEQRGQWDGTWIGTGAAIEEMIETSDGEILFCGGGWFKIRVLGTNIGGTVVDENAWGYQLSATLSESGEVLGGAFIGLSNGGVWDGTFSDEYATGEWEDNYGCRGVWNATNVNDDDTYTNQLGNLSETENNTNSTNDDDGGNQTNSMNENNGDNQTNSTNANEEPADPSLSSPPAGPAGPVEKDVDFSLADIPGVKPMAKLVIGEPYESEPDSEGETSETATQIGIIAGSGGIAQTIRPRRPKPPTQTSVPKIIKEVGSTIVDSAGGPISFGVGGAKMVGENMEKANEKWEDRKGKFGDVDNAKNFQEESEIMDANSATLGPRINQTPTDGNDLKEVKKMVGDGIKSVIVGLFSCIGGGVVGGVALAVSAPASVVLAAGAAGTLICGTIAGLIL